ncbi:PREDICTED: putative sodium-dependent multivitamin transporter [Priapulus caudatus]|uniref:Sodium-dependent multivitamin transporter n=1 Tax=Priapulus caudatus TaxID=37621 RepID=A0ABM1EG47_PRICU|nr:PREDICTED: putative sodium-dependent multivitamin transporter [Priapulus caudatus]
MAFIFWIGFGGMALQNSPDLLPTSAHGCNISDVMNASALILSTADNWDVNQMTAIATNPSIVESANGNYMYRISYMWYALISVIACTLIGVAVSCVTGRNKKPASARLFWPPVLRYSRFLPPIITCEEEKKKMTEITLNTATNKQMAYGKLPIHPTCNIQAMTCSRATSA